MEQVKINVPVGYELKQEGNTYTIVEKELELEVGKDYVAKQDEDSIVIDRKGNFGNVGFLNGEFFNCIACITPSLWLEATEEEVIESFEKECARRLGENWRGVKIKECMSNSEVNLGNRWAYIGKGAEGWEVWNKNGCLYRDGKWAEKLEEPKFAESLEDIDRPFLVDAYGTIEKWGYGQDKNYLPTEELAEGLLALIQLLSFRHDVWEKEGKPEEICWGVLVTPDMGVYEIDVDDVPFRFKKKETAKWFMEKHKQLLEEYLNKIVL